MRSADVVGGLRERREEDVRPARMPSSCVQTQPSRASACARRLAGLRFRDDLLEQRTGLRDIAGLELPLGRLDAAAVALVGRSGRGQPPGLLQQLGRGIGRAARRGAPGRLVERCGHRLVRAVRRQREMPRPRLRVVEDLRDAGVELAQLALGEQLVGDGGEQRVREREPLAGALEDARRDRRRASCRRAPRRAASTDDTVGRASAAATCAASRASAGSCSRRSRTSSCRLAGMGSSSEGSSRSPRSARARPISSAK